MENFEFLKNKTLTFFDTEFPNRKNDSICSIGLIVVKNGEMQTKEYYLVNPEDTFDPFYTHIHHITQDMVKDQPTFPVIWEKIKQYFINSIVVGHNLVSADLPVLNKCLDRYGIDKPDIYYMDTLLLSKQYLAPKYGIKCNLATLSEFFHIPLNHHNAFSDTEACLGVFMKNLETGEVTEDDIYQYMPHESPRKHYRADHRLIDKAMNALSGLIQGINADQEINREEALALEKWLETNKDICNDYRLIDVYNTIAQSMRDGVIESCELDRILSKVNTYFYRQSYTNSVDKIQEFMGIIEGISADQDINIEEVYLLENWMNDNKDLKGNYPFDKFFDLTHKVLEDNCISKDESVEILKLCDVFLNPHKDEGVHICLEGKRFCITGEFSSLSREEIQQLIENHNGIFAKSVTKKLDYLVLGGIQNPAWKFGQYGTKYNKAREYQEKGVPISIITEEEFLKLFEGD